MDPYIQPDSTTGILPGNRYRRLVEDAPSGVGVYIIRDRDGACLYIGKSIALRKRLADHAQQAVQGVVKERLIMDGAATVEYLLTATETESFLLENALIKRHQPKYNVVLRDDKSYPHIRIDTRLDFPRIEVVRRPRRDGALYFGPYVSVRALRRTLHFLGTVFPLRPCAGSEPPKRSRHCLNHEIGRCLGPCSGGIDRDRYHEAVNELILFLKGHRGALVRRLRRQMSAAAAELRYEDAARLRDRLGEIEDAFERQSIEGADSVSLDILGLAHHQRGWAVYVLRVRHGQVVSGEPHQLAVDPSLSEPELLGECIERLYAGASEVPRRILLPVKPAGQEELEALLGAKAGHTVTIAAPSRGRGLDLLLMARRNAMSIHQERRPATLLPFSVEAAAEWRDRFGSIPQPERIEIYDASNLGGTDGVVGMVAWDRGRLPKEEKRRFAVRSASSGDDYGMLREALSRRLARVARGTEAMPDAIVVDGGAGHVGAMRSVLDGFEGARPLLLGIAKGERRRDGDHLFGPDAAPLGLPPDSPLVRFIGGLRDDVHRYTVAYQRVRRGLGLTRSVMDRVPGVGAKRKSVLLAHFGSPETVASATLEDLAAVPGIPATVARDVYRHFHPGG
jgi:excinuclease ABC subunit C